MQQKQQKGLRLSTVITVGCWEQLGADAALHVMHVQGNTEQLCMCKLACFTGRCSAMKPALIRREPSMLLTEEEE